MFKLRKKKEKCVHEWTDLGKVLVDTSYGVCIDFDWRHILFCPICEKEITVTEQRAKIELEKVRVRNAYHKGKV